MSLFPLKLVERSFGSELTILGGVISFGPPVGETMVAQARANKGTAAGIRNLSACLK